MKHLNTFRASKVFTHIEMDIKFFPELTFIYGLNGSGKTTALRLIMGLLTPSLQTLGAIEFSNISLSGESHDHGEITISAEKTDTQLALSCSTCEETFVVPLDLFDMEDSARLIAREVSRSTTIDAIREISSPMFLGIDRRFIMPGMKKRRNSNVSSRDMASNFRHKRMIEEESSYDPGLAEVADLINTYVGKLHGAQEIVNEKFRKQLLLESFSFVDPSTQGISFETPSEEEYIKFRKKRKAISEALTVLDLASDEFETKSESFFSSMEGIITTLRESTKKSSKGKKLDSDVSEALTAWFVNKSQMNRIDRLFDMTTKYQDQTEKNYKSMNDFMELVNQFFSQTGKEFSLRRDGAVRIKMPNGSSSSLKALSSGERQIFIMLAHLSLNKGLLRDGIFIIDEPELSLHMGWQDMFVEAIQKANPRLQLILATHAPAIIGGRDELCVPVSSIKGK